ncbi:MAG: RagB/SusD family nutrient uptake outer membrane protein [Bacteroidales bacterium]|jgi:hypothetical protein|nr:RagB/SusD family nutrient uptake outer membrane protein [Bacteroidales bacterium]
MKNKKYFAIITGIWATTGSILTSCSEYLDVVPDNTVTLDHLFMLREDAWNALAKVYSYMPNDANPQSTSYLLGDEWLGKLEYENNDNTLYGIRIMRGAQSLTNPLLGDWSGTRGGVPLYQGIRQANVFLQNISKVQDMTETEKTEWKSQVLFLKAYYVFRLVQKYGPVVLEDDIIEPNDPPENLFKARSKVEDCFDYILKLMNEAIPGLRERALSNNAGQVDRVVALAIKTRVLLFRASEFYNGNFDYYDNFLDLSDPDKKPFFPITYDKEKWKDVIDAADEAIRLCEDNEIDLYRYEGAPYLYDREDYAANPVLRTIYDLRFSICEPWNKELIWGYSSINIWSDNNIQAASNVRLPEEIEGDDHSSSGAWQWLGATYEMLERYYTTNGLPIEEDRTFNTARKLTVLSTPEESDETSYAPYRGIMQPASEAVYLYLNREPRFYAHLGITGGYFRSHLVRIPFKGYMGSTGGYEPSINAGDFFVSGIGVQKFVHPESKSGHAIRIKSYPPPIIRMADLYLMKAEAMNEYYDTPTPEIWELINKIRTRAGVPNVETVYGNPSLVVTNSINKHTKKTGLREIILRERSIEFAFEGGIHFWDMFRYKKAVTSFSAPVRGWNYKGGDADKFFSVLSLQNRKFTVTDCLWPIDLNEMNTNANLIQNPGW